MTRVYLSYRREDGEQIAQRIADRLGEQFEVVGHASTAEAESAVMAADVLVAVIGARWTDIMRQRRLDGSPDAVSAELVTALRRGVLVIPVLVGGAGMPSRSELPEPLAELAGKRAVIVGTDSFTSDSFQLMSEIERRAPEVHQESSPENKDAVRQRRITELQDGIRSAAEAGDWQTVLNFGSELSSLRPPNDDPDGLVTMARQRLAEARRRRLNSNPELDVEVTGPGAVQDADDEVEAKSSPAVTPVGEPPSKPVTSSVMPILVLVLVILLVVLVLVTI
ncbi:MAG TPA: hypothetical protein VNT27_01005 [Propionibacteriaceae bacterium]|nr:hypothetical protein [Propionibacteriaceae bacterium]